MTNRPAACRQHETALDFRDQFADKRLAPGAVRRAVGIFMMAPLALAVQQHADEFHLAFARLRRPGGGAAQRFEMTPPKPGDFVDHRVTPLGMLVVASR